ncbi:hypothetical protein CH373_17215 [Leptospira perolatii]|uniref:Uncharacterized protein n=1 Tax=Leptospira perolatii TaxID=2023191 RepID=A0A2M9ZIR7_9LEPT|nr:hypothetical protein CH360_15675 [Leptospira perolatii]PJZ71864.1 hypothetical protein CH373_17215 [Leptospira perolatii]
MFFLGRPHPFLGGGRCGGTGTAVRTSHEFSFFAIFFRGSAPCRSSYRIYYKTIGNPVKNLNK